MGSPLARSCISPRLVNPVLPGPQVQAHTGPRTDLTSPLMMASRTAPRRLTRGRRAPWHSPPQPYGPPIPQAFSQPTRPRRRMIPPTPTESTIKQTHEKPATPLIKWTEPNKAIPGGGGERSETSHTTEGPTTWPRHVFDRVCRCFFCYWVFLGRVHRGFIVVVSVYYG